ncbi:hypothetical protein [Actinosynnema pretiosum]|uniref:hypothetical protein n=1 Tax=Actinosynnema pretiosum TaxID=42197 RepID=UPI000AADFA81|nr:hypothetical protein [Actinosynnema pretiosum]
MGAKGKKKDGKKGEKKVKSKCCRSTPRCKRCPVVVFRKAKEKAARKAAEEGGA